MIPRSLVEIACHLGGELVGDGSVVIQGLAGIQEAGEGEITFVASPKYFPLLKTTQASAVIVPWEVKDCPKPIIRVHDPYLSFLKVVEFLGLYPPQFPRGVHETAVLGQNVKWGRDVSIQAHVVLRDNVELGDRVTILPGVVIGDDCRIGDDTLIYPNATIWEGVVIGKRVIIHSGAVIGSNGFGYIQHDGKHLKIPQIGRVVIEDEVEIGANVTIDRATLGETRIGRGTKLDNLIQVAHNVVIGQNTVMAAQVGVSGSTQIGSGVTVGGQAGFVDHIKVGDGAAIAAQAGVTKSIPPRQVVSGYPARPHRLAKRIEACHPRLPELIKLVREQQRRIEELEKRLGIIPQEG